MTFYDRFETTILWAVTAIVSAGATVAGWLVRTLLTNQKQIEQLRQEIEDREARRALEMAALNELRTDVRELRIDVRTLFSQKGE